MRPGTALPLNYHHAVAQAIYRKLGSASIEFATNLHDVGYRTNGHVFKLFTFSRLQTTKAHRQDDKLLLEHPEIFLQVSSPVAAFIEHLIGGISMGRIWNIAGSKFQFIRAELVPPPIFHETMRFHALSPITEWIRGEREHPTFLSLTDEWSEIMRANLVRKYKALYDCEPENQKLIWSWDDDYIDRAEQRGKRLSVLREIHGINIRGWLAPFTIEGSKELIELGYEAGFGARNSMGFGMAEVDTFSR
ncbi:MAG: CRISPR-associated endoribonuclease Cas6 [Pyrinomonadaceae bacterium]